VTGRPAPPPVEFVTTTWCRPGQGGEVAAEAEALGFDVQALGVNECMSADVFAELRAGAAATTSIRLMPGVANFVTRHPVVVAGGCAALSLVSGGRAICGVGKGDSAVGMLGLRPQRHADYVRDVARVREYLAGRAVDVDGARSSLHWLLEGWPPVELDMFASGPRSIAAAATYADRITLAVGAAPDRLRWALGIIDETLARCGRARADVRVGACIPFAIADDPAVADELLRPMVLGWAHMSSFRGMDLDEQPELLRRVTTVARDHYSYAYHSNEAAPENPLTQGLDPAFVDWFGIAGDPSTLACRLLDLHELGIQHFFVASAGEQHQRWAREVMPRVRRAVTAEI
jgi:5,10-methylenetetrahydromethanopterin reductase